MNDFLGYIVDILIIRRLSKGLFMEQILNFKEENSDGSIR